MNEVCGQSAVELICSEHGADNVVDAAIFEHFGARAPANGDLYFILAKCGKRLAVGIGSNKIKRERSVKLAMAITYAVHRRVEFVEAWASSVANKIAAAAEVALDATGWSAHGPLQHSASGHSPRASDKSPMLTIGASSETTLRNVQRAPSGAPPKATRPLPAAPPHQPRDTSKALSWLSCVASEDNTHLAWAPPLASSSSSSSGCHYVSQRSQLQHTRPRQVSASPKEGGQAKRAGALHITSPSGLDVVAASKEENIASLPWCPTAFDIAAGHEVDQTIIFREGSSDGPFIAFGEVVCSDRYILWQAHVCNRVFRRAPVNFHKMYEFPHMTLARLEQGYAERRANKSLWLVDGHSGPEEFDLSDVLRQLNESLHQNTVVYRLHDGHLSPNYYGCRYDITGGQARTVYRKVQDDLRVHIGHLGDRVSFWAEEPAHPHITFEYLDDDMGCAQDMDLVHGDAASSFGNGPSERSLTSSIDIVLKKLDEHRLGQLKPIFEREQLSRSVLPLLTDNQLKEVGITRLGERQKVLAMAAALLS